MKTIPNGAGLVLSWLPSGIMMEMKQYYIIVKTSRYLGKVIRGVKERLRLSLIIPSPSPLKERGIQGVR